MTIEIRRDALRLLHAPELFSILRIPNITLGAFLMPFDTSTLFAVGAAAFSGLSAIYARWQANATKRANEISLHQDRLSVYRGALRFASHVAARGTHVKEGEVWLFRESVDSSEFYYSASIPKDLAEVFEKTLRLLTLNDEWEHARQSHEPNAIDLNTQRHEIMRSVRDTGYKIANEMKVHLRVGRI